jgi:hypothetical protein
MFQHALQAGESHSAAQAAVRFREQMRVREMQNTDGISECLNRASLELSDTQ